jgi:tRNA G18 (ribose-2'-O)-methylase SpoU
MGSIFYVPVLGVGEFGALPGTKLALDAGAPDELCGVVGRIDPQIRKQPLTLVVGSEREGLPEHVLASCDHVARIPINTHSLNAAMAATVALYELRNRRITAA